MKSVHEVRALLAASADERALGATRSLAQALVDWFPGHATYLDSALSAWMCKRVYGGKPVVFHKACIAGGAPALRHWAVAWPCVLLELHRITQNGKAPCRYRVCQYGMVLVVATSFT